MRPRRTPFVDQRKQNRGLLCSHCRARLICRPRGLCHRCYYSPARNLYTPSSIHAHRGIGNGYIAPPLPATPTDARPGSPEKLAVMAARAERGEHLHHPDDERTPLPPPDPANLERKP